MEAAGTVILKPIGDVELWYAEPADGAWRLPVHIEWKQHPGTGEIYGLVLPGVCFYQIQLLAVGAILQHYSLEERVDRWLLPRQNVEALLRKAPGIHADFYYLWSGSDHPPIPSQHTITLSVEAGQPRSKSVQVESFAQFVSAERHVPADVVNVVLTAIAQVGPKWLVERRRLIDLGFVKLVALPFRANWKEIVMWKGKSRNLLKALLAPSSERKIRLHALRFAALLASPHNVALRGRSLSQARLEYSIEAMTTTQFDAQVDRIEGARMKSGNYVLHYSKGIEKLYEPIVAVMAQYAQKIMAAWAAVRESRHDGSLAFVPKKRHVVGGVPLTSLPVDSIPTGSNFSVHAEQEAQNTGRPLSAPADDVPAVSVVSPPADDVRQRGLGRDVG